MIRFLFRKMLKSMQNRYDYDVRYANKILDTDQGAFLKYLGFQIMASHTGGIPAAPVYAARLRAIIWDDCGPCTQLITNMALEANVDPNVVHAIIKRDVDSLPDDIALVVEFSEHVLAHNPSADALREKIVNLWGMKGLVAISFAISSTRVFPALKYSMGYGNVCSRVQFNDQTLTPQRQSL